MIIIPAIDLRDGRVVRLKQGDYKQETLYSDTPLAVAKEFEAAKASRLHVVDLDGAKDGSPKNRDIIIELAKKCNMPIEVGGGIRTVEAAQYYLDNGVDYVIVGSMAINDFERLKTLVSMYPSRIIVGVDAKDGMVATEGWRNETSVDSETFIKTLQTIGVKTVIFTDIAKDGMLEGINAALYAKLVARTHINIIASGGVSTKEDIETLRAINVYGVIIGRALDENALRLEDVM